MKKKRRKRKIPRIYPVPKTNPPVRPMMISHIPVLYDSYWLVLIYDTPCITFA